MMMRTPAAADLLDAWERGLAEPPPARPLALLAAALPEVPAADLAALSVGRRDAALLTLRERVFGTRMSCIAACPSCAAPVELDFAADDIRCPPPPGAGPVGVVVEDYALRLRPPTTDDLLAAAWDGDAALTILRRCLLETKRDGEPCEAEALPPSVVAAAEAALAQADAQADVRLVLTCPVCAQEWSASFDIARHLWTEVGAWAARLLGEVHALASAYGWSEGEILAMNATRRGLYLEMLGR